LLPVEPLVSAAAPSPLRTMPAIWLVVEVGFDAVPAVPVLPLLLTIAPAAVAPLTVPAGWTGSHSE
jgi:hypothetical protein